MTKQGISAWGEAYRVATRPRGRCRRGMCVAIFSPNVKNPTTLELVSMYQGNKVTQELREQYSEAEYGESKFKEHEEIALLIYKLFLRVPKCGIPASLTKLNSTLFVNPKWHSSSVIALAS